MAKKSREPESITLRYDLYDLPTAQHKAGLAGLLLEIESMAERVERGLLPSDTPLVKIIDQGPTHAEIEVTRDSTQALFDDLYDAEVVEVAVSTKWPKKEPKRVEQTTSEQSGSTTTTTRYIYDTVRPCGGFLSRYTDDGKETWHKLWRDMLWSIPRGKPATRRPFNDRSEGKHTSEGSRVWDSLVADERARQRGQRKLVPVAGAIMLGAQAASAEAVRFEDFSDQAALLHFWQLACRVYVPEELTADGKREFAGFVLALPEVSDLARFARAYCRALHRLDPESRGYRPAAAVVSLPEQGALEFLYSLDLLLQQRTAHAEPRQHLSGVEFFHMVKVGNNVKSASHGRVAPRTSLLRGYEGIRCSVRNPILLTARLRALLTDQPWFALLQRELVDRDWSWFVHSQQDGHRTPPAMVNFAYEIATQFENIQDRLQKLKEALVQGDCEAPPTSPGIETGIVDLVIYRLVKEYIRQKASARMGVDTADAQWHAKTHDHGTGGELPRYKEERQRASAQLFLALRSRRAEDFVAHFTATLGSVAQRLPESDYTAIASALMRVHTSETGEQRPRTRDDVKTLTLLALSAHSRSLSARRQPEGSETPTEETDQ